MSKAYDRLNALPCFERIKVTTGNCYLLIPTTLKFIFPQRYSDVEKTFSQNLYL